MSKSVKRLICGLIALVMVMGFAINPLHKVFAAKKISKEIDGKTIENKEMLSENKKDGKAKYVFLFIGDGMAHPQVQAAQIFTGKNKKDEIDLKKVNFSNFETVGVATTHDSTSFCPDSASTATAIAGGVKTHSGTIGLSADKTKKVKTVAEYAKDAGMKVGIISSVTLNHATPAAFYANVESRGSYYEIGKQMAESNFDYFAGGSLGKRRGKEGNQKDLYEIMEEKGYKVTQTRAEFEKIKSGNKVYAVSERLQDSGSMPYSIDQRESDLTLKDFVKKAIEVLDNEKGFFIMVESGKIDWACHANDAGTTIHEVLGLEDAVEEALNFYEKHPDDTLILVTGDHETGGLTIGHATTGYDTALSMIEKQKMSYVDFDSKFNEMKEKNKNLKLEDIISEIERDFGLKVKKDVKENEELKDEFILTAYEYNLLKNAFEESMKKEDDRVKSQESNLLYGGYNPISVTLTHILNNKSGIGWTSYAHTGVPVAVYARGKTSESYNGYYDNTDIFKKMMDSIGLKY